MPEEPVVESDSGPDDFWKPAMKIGIKFIAMVIVVYIFKIGMELVFSTMAGMDWIQPDMFGRYPLYDILFDVALGGLLLALAVFFAREKGRAAAWLEKLQPVLTRRRTMCITSGALLGVVAAFGTLLLLTFTDTYFYGGKLFLELQPYLLLKSLLFLLPELVLYAGWVVLVQGYFQRETRRHYGALEGLIIAVLAYMALVLVPYNLDTLAYPLFSARYLLMGAIMGYLYLKSRSLFFPMGFIVAYNFFFHAYYGVIGIYVGPGASFMGIDRADASLIDLLVAGILILALIWYVFRSGFFRQPVGLRRLKVTIDDVLSRLAR